MGHGRGVVYVCVCFGDMRASKTLVSVVGGGGGVVYRVYSELHHVLILYELGNTLRQDYMIRPG